MVHAFIMTKTAPGASETVVRDVTELEQVEEAHVVAGEFDVIVEVDVDEVYDVMQAASVEIQGIDGVTDTKTYISLH